MSDSDMPKPPDKPARPSVNILSLVGEDPEVAAIAQKVNALTKEQKEAFLAALADHVTVPERAVPDSCGVEREINGVLVPLHAQHKTLKLEGADRRENMGFNRQMLEFFTDEFIVQVPLAEAMQVAVGRCFDKGISLRDVLHFFESDEVMSFAFKKSLERFKTSEDPHSEVHNMTVEQHREYLRLRDGFIEEYDPNYPDHSFSAFAQRVADRFEGTNFYPLLEGDIHKFISLLRDETPLKKGMGHGHISQLIMEQYCARGKKNPREFIRLNLKSFFTFDQRGKHFILDMKELVEFFFELLPGIFTNKSGIGELRMLLIKECLSFVQMHDNRDSVKIAIKSRAGVTGRVVTLLNFEEFRGNFSQIVYVATKSADSDDNLLADPQYSPAGFDKLYETLYPEADLKLPAYERYLRMVYGAVGESVEEIEERLEALFEMVDQVLEAEAIKAGIPEELIGEVFIDPNIRSTVHIGSLIEMACNLEDYSPEVRFAARRKLVLANTLFANQISRLEFIDQDHNYLKEKLLHQNGDLGVHVLANDTSKVYLTHSASGKFKVEIVDPGQKPRKEKGPTTSPWPRSYGNNPLLQDDSAYQLKEKAPNAHLIRATLYGVEGYLMVVSDEDESYEWLSKKSIFSMLPKISRKGIGVENMNDLHRFTFIAESQKDIDTIRRRIGDAYVSGNGVAVDDHFRSTPLRPANNNGSTSSEYRAIQYVLKTFVKDDRGHGFQIQYEVRIGLSDLLLEKHPLHPLSHEDYEQRRAAKVIHSWVPPFGQWLEFYNQNPRTGEYTLKSSEELKQIAESRKSQNQLD